MTNRISIAMTVFNGERFVRDELESFARQERLPDELVVCDDRSADRTVEIVKEFAACAPFPVRVFINEERLGHARNYERAMQYCVGDLIFVADWDDVWYPHRLLRMEQAFDQSPNAGVVVCNADLVNENLQPLRKTLWQASGTKVPERTRYQMAEGCAFISGLAVNGCCLAVRARFRSLIFPIYEGSPYIWPDVFMAWTIALSGAGGIAVVPEPLLAYRQHKGQMSGAGGKAYNLTGLLAERFARARKRPPLGPFIQRLESHSAASLSRNQSLREAALCHFRARWNLPAKRISRTTIVARELLAGRYHQFSHGFGAAFKDLFVVE